MLNNKRGFTLIELLVVIAIIGILAGLLITGIASARQKAKNIRAIQEFNQIGLAIQMYYDQNSTWPGTNGPFSAYVSSEQTVGFSFGDYSFKEETVGDQIDDRPAFVPEFYPTWDASWYCDDCKLYFDIVDFSGMTTEYPTENFKPDCIFVYIVKGIYPQIGKCSLCLTNECPYCGYIGGIN